MFCRKIIIFTRNSIIESLKKIKERTTSNSSRKAFAELPIAVMSAVLVGTVIVTSAAGYNLYDSAVGKVLQLRMARALADDEAERIRSAGYDDVVKIEKPNGTLSNGYVEEVVLGKEYREDIGNSVLKHKPVTINVYDSESSFFPLVSVKTEKVSRWYKSGTFDNSNLGVYDETGEQHKGTIKKTGNGTGYVFLKKGAKINGDVEIYDETNGDIYISNAIGTPGKKTLIRHVGPATGSGYIRLAESCTINGTVTLENSSNGGLIIETNISDGSHIAKLGSGTGYLKLAKGSSLGKNVKVTNESAGPIVVYGTLFNGSILTRNGNSDGVLTVIGSVNGNVGIEMVESGRLNLQGTCQNSTNVKYVSSTNQLLQLTATKIKGNVYITNNSKGGCTFTGIMTDGCSLNINGVGRGKTFMHGTVEGRANIINDTGGYISVSVPIKDGKTITKTGGGTGYLAIGTGILKGDFTLDSDASGRFIFSAATEAETKVYRQPVIEDGVYVKIRGKLKGFARFWIGVQVLGSMDIDVTSNPNVNLSWGYFQNGYSGYVDQIIPDGYTYKN